MIDPEKLKNEVDSNQVDVFRMNNIGDQFENFSHYISADFNLFCATQNMSQQDRILPREFVKPKKYIFAPASIMTRKDLRDNLDPLLWIKYREI